MAHKGTIFLDEISSTPLNVQARLLRVLQEKKVRRIGGDGYIPIDVRVVAVSNRNLLEEVRSGRFREDLFFRLNVLVINMPPLRERIEDLPIIFDELMMRIADKYGMKPMSIPDQAIRQMMQYPWHGNIRQLENFIERLLLLSDTSFDMGLFHDLFEEVEAYSFAGSGKEPVVGPGGAGGMVPARNRDIREILSDVRYCKTKAAQILGISRTTLWRKMKNMDVKRQ